MASFFKKALSVFVEFEDEHNNKTPDYIQSSNIPAETRQNLQLNTPEAEKFEKYFDNLFESANLPGPDYYEFQKTMELLEAHIPDESARISATFASLSIQGLTKQKLLETAAKYKEIIEKDYLNFEAALNEKLKTEVGQRQKDIKSYEETIRANSDLIQKLTKEITDAQVQISKLTGEVTEHENKLTINKGGYKMASQAVINKIATDIQHIQTKL